MRCISTNYVVNKKVVFLAVVLGQKKLNTCTLQNKKKKKLFGSSVGRGSLQRSKVGATQMTWVQIPAMA